MKKLILLICSLLANCGALIASDNFTGYLFVYFTGNDISDESVHYALSRDGFNFFSLNGNKPVVESALISETGGVRDPHILRRADGNGFYMVVTDMVSAHGWDSNRGMTLLKSSDLINWQASVINIQKRFPGNEDLLRVWAPQTIYDDEAGKYMVYWSMKHGDGPDIIYYSYANSDFTDLESEPQPLFIPSGKLSCIDGDIVFHDGVYHLFYKTEGNGNGIRKAVTKSLTSGEWMESDEYKQLTDKAVEGSGIFKLNGSDSYVLMYDVYMDGQYQFTESEDLDKFRLADHKVSMDFHPRHGSVLPVTETEYQLLLGQYASFPEQAGPVLPGFHADPEIIHSGLDGKYYIYSTTDGLPGWGGCSFSVFSSDNLAEWTDEGVAIDLSGDQVAWASGNAWAPAAIEVPESDGSCRYYLYFSGHSPELNRKVIGVATADTPVGPFVDSGSPIISDSPVGFGQQIDVDVFRDPVSGKYYLYWGNGYMAGAELNADMKSVNSSTVTVLTPEGGTLADYAYREAPYVFYRNGKYYFMWSVDDTGSPNYHVAYGTADSPLGPVKVAEEPVVMSQCPGKSIYGPAHNSVICVPGTDSWFIVYHRINPDYLDDNPGIHRQVCISRMEFNEDGTIKPVKF